ncbi:hypothetical protein [Streptomyces sp. NPDC058629]|uniref:hypothetical protein n=1 Tax=Streptomyces sp. NPDC058629 TaxID=3346565 RepID=UPI003660D690
MVIEVSASAATVVGYQVASTEALGRQERTVYIPLLAPRLKKAGRSGSFLTWENVQAIGHDAVMARTHALQDADGDLAAPAAVCKDLVGRRILTDQGVEAGTFQGIDIDTDTGAVLAVHSANDQHPGAALTGIGSYALIIATAS